MKNEHLELLAHIRWADKTAPVPTAAELASHLAARLEHVGAAALAEFAYVQRVAAARWGAASTSHFGRVLRDARVNRKAPRKSHWERAEDAVARLPTAWRPAMLQRIAVSRNKRRRREPVWSASYTFAVAVALSRWAQYCADCGIGVAPTGTSLERYAHSIGEARNEDDRVSVCGIADYLARIVAGYRLVDPDFHSVACAFVLRDWRERADLGGSPTKTGNQLVTASAIYDLGLAKTDKARSRSLRGIHAAKEYRNGLILAIGAALPQRARALSALVFDRTLFLLGEDAIRVTIPAEMLKGPEAEKADSASFDRVFRNPILHRVLVEYRAAFRPIFDDGDCLFPSVHAPGDAISERRIGALAGNMTKKEFAVRVSLHRIRDNVATEASERLPGGAYLAQRLLGHRRMDTTAEHYDRAEGVLVSEEFGESLAARRRAPVDLELWTAPADRRHSPQFP